MLLQFLCQDDDLTSDSIVTSCDNSSHNVLRQFRCLEFALICFSQVINIAPLQESIWEIENRSSLAMIKSRSYDNSSCKLLQENHLQVMWLNEGLTNKIVVTFCEWYGRKKVNALALRMVVTKTIQWIQLKSGHKY